MEPLWMMAAYHHLWNSAIWTGKDIHGLNGYTSIYLKTFKGTKQIPTQIPQPIRFRTILVFCCWSPGTSRFRNEALACLAAC